MAKCAGSTQCGHMSCCTCKGTDGNALRYCGACGHVFVLLNGGSTAQYAHACKGNPTETNMFRAQTRKPVLAAYDAAMEASGSDGRR